MKVPLLMDVVFDKLKSKCFAIRDIARRIELLSAAINTDQSMTAIEAERLKSDTAIIAKDLHIEVHGLSNTVSPAAAWRMFAENDGIKVDNNNGKG